MLAWSTTKYFLMGEKFQSKESLVIFVTDYLLISHLIFSTQCFDGKAHIHAGAVQRFLKEIKYAVTNRLLTISTEHMIF